MSLPLESPYPFSLTAVADKTLNGLFDATFRIGWSPITRLAEATTVSFLRKIKTGHLRIITLTGVYDFPDESSREDQQCCDDNNQHESHLKAELRIKDDAFWVRLCMMGDLGFSEAYMFGDVECNDLISVFRIFWANRESLTPLSSWFSYLVSPLQKFTSYRFMNTIGNSRSNMSAHYDISNDMFAGFLSEDMTYSCAIFPEVDGDLHDPACLTDLDDSHADLKQDQLYLGQMHKLQNIIKKLRIPPANESKEPVHVLEIGSGWGSLSILLAQQYPNVDIDTLTLSSQQKALAEGRIASKGLSGRIRVHLMDYRNMPSEWAGRFARFVSIEMIEHVGSVLEEYWRIVDWAMEKEGSIGVVQVITIPEAIFPGGLLPTFTFLVSTLTSGSQGRLVVEAVSNIGPHYARTLREWRRRFESKFESRIVPGLRKEYAARTGEDGNKLSREDIDVFKRKWIYYYCYCEIGFTTRSLGDHIVTFTREGNQEYGCDVLA